MRHAAKRDDVEPGIVKALELAGWTVIRLSDKGAPDLLAIRKGRLVPIECKSPGGTLTPAQETAFARWVAAGLPVHVVRTPAEALLAVAQGVEGLLSPLKRAADEEILRAADVTTPPLPTEEPARTQEVIRRGCVVAQLLTPAYQKAQTAAVVPNRKKR